MEKNERKTEENKKKKKQDSLCMKYFCYLKKYHEYKNNERLFDLN